MFSLHFYSPCTGLTGADCADALGVGICTGITAGPFDMGLTKWVLMIAGLHVVVACLPSSTLIFWMYGSDVSENSDVDVLGLLRIGVESVDLSAVTSDSFEVAASSFLAFLTSSWCVTTSA